VRFQKLLNGFERGAPQRHLGVLLPCKRMPQDTRGALTSARIKGDMGSVPNMFHFLHPTTSSASSRVYIVGGKYSKAREID
jgi:hypothetical protein